MHAIPRARRSRFIAIRAVQGIPCRRRPRQSCRPDQAQSYAHEARGMALVNLSGVVCARSSHRALSRRLRGRRVHGRFSVVTYRSPNKCWRSHQESRAWISSAVAPWLFSPWKMGPHPRECGPGQWHQRSASLWREASWIPTSAFGRGPARRPWSGSLRCVFSW
jgi:hypothetical protein